MENLAHAQDSYFQSASSETRWHVSVGTSSSQTPIRVPAQPYAVGADLLTTARRDSSESFDYEALLDAVDDELMRPMLLQRMAETEVIEVDFDDL